MSLWNASSWRTSFAAYAVWSCAPLGLALGDLAANAFIDRVRNCVDRDRFLPWKMAPSGAE